MLIQCPSWTLDPEGRAITRRYAFSDFSSCFAFMTRCALLAQTLDHHPDFIQSYNKLDIRLTTHDAGGLSLLDIEMAKAIDVIPSS